MRTGVTRAEKEASFAEWGMELAKPKVSKRKAKPEDALHISVASFLRRAIGHEGFASPDGVSWCSEDLAGIGHKTTTKTGKQIDLAAIKRKAHGCIPGRPDIEVLFRGVKHSIELKAKDGRLSESQIAYHATLRACGSPVAVCRSVEEVQTTLICWAIPLRAKVSA